MISPSAHTSADFVAISLPPSWGRLVRVGEVARQVGPHHQQAGRNASAVEQVRRQADDRLDQILLEELGADFLLGPATEQDALGHDGTDHPLVFAHRQHVLGEHQVRLLAAGRAPTPAEALRELHVALGVVLAERRIGNDPVETL
jgi:hypothetical protein